MCIVAVSVEKCPGPELEAQEVPEALAVGFAAPVLADERLDVRSPEPPSLSASLREHNIVQERAQGSAKPLIHRNEERVFSTRQGLSRQQASHRPAQEPFRAKCLDLERDRFGSEEF